jgi:predicted O-methyltransferase YrrM
MRRLILQTVRTQTVATLVTGWLAGALGLGLATSAGAVPTAALMALGPLLGAMLLLIRHNLDLASRIGNLAAESKRTLDTVRRLEADSGKQVKQAFRQLEALQNLSAMLPADRLLPATRGWAASPDLLAVLVDVVITERPSLIVECGSGASTLWLALAMRRFEIDGRVIALEHDPGFGDSTRGFLARHGVEELAEVRDAPLESFSLDGETYPWYARRAWEDLSGVNLLFVDGPPAATAPLARYPALPLLSRSLNPVATVVVDDLVVPDMEAVLRRWLDAYPEFSSEILPLEKQAAVLRRRGPRLGPKFEDDVDRGLGDQPELAEAGVAGQLPDRGGTRLGTERDPARLGEGGRRALERGRGVAERGHRAGQVRGVVVGGGRLHDQDGAVGGEGLAGVGQRGGRVAEVVEDIQQADQVEAVGRVAGRVERLELDAAAEAGLASLLPGDGDGAVVEVVPVDARLRVGAG